MKGLNDSRSIKAARLRKTFNRKNRHISINDLVRTDAGKIGEYQGISTFGNISRISVKLYEPKKTEEEIKKLADSGEVKELVLNGLSVPVVYYIIKRPPMTPETISPSSYSRYGY